MSSYSNDIDSSFDDNDSYYENSQCYDGNSYSDDECSVESYSADSSKQDGCDEDLQTESPPLQISVPVNININVNCPCNDCDNDVKDDDSSCDDNSDNYDDADDVISDSHENDSREEDFQDDDDSACDSNPEIAPPTKNDGTASEEINKISIDPKIRASHDYARDDDSVCDNYYDITAKPVKVKNGASNDKDILESLKEIYKDADEICIDSYQELLDVETASQIYYLETCKYASETYERINIYESSDDMKCLKEKNVNKSCHYLDLYNLRLKTLQEIHKDADEECISSYENLLFVKVKYRENYMNSCDHASKTYDAYQEALFRQQTAHPVSASISVSVPNEVSAPAIKILDSVPDFSPITVSPASASIDDSASILPDVLIPTPVKNYIYSSYSLTSRIFDAPDPDGTIYYSNARQIPTILLMSTSILFQTFWIQHLLMILPRF